MNDLDKNRDYCGRPSWLFAAWLRANRYAAQIRFERATPNINRPGAEMVRSQKEFFFLRIPQRDCKRSAQRIYKRRSLSLIQIDDPSAACFRALRVLFIGTIVRHSKSVQKQPDSLSKIGLFPTAPAARQNPALILARRGRGNRLSRAVGQLWSSALDDRTCINYCAEKITPLDERLKTSRRDFIAIGA